MSFTNYLSFIGGFLSKDVLLDRISYLPSHSLSARFVNKNDFSFFYSKSNSPLYNDLLLENENGSLFLNGFFYSELEKPLLSKMFFEKKDLLLFFKRFVKELNGSYNGFYFDAENQKVFLFSDYLGYEKIFYSSVRNKLIFSSFIWPLVSKDYELDYNSVTEHLAHGHSLGLKTLFKNIFVIKPGHLNGVTNNNELTKPIDIFEFNNYSNQNPDSLAEEFFSCFNKNVQFIKKSLPTDELITTLTGGGETRVMLNGFVNNKEKPVCVTGSYPLSDIPRAKAISNLVNLDNIIVNYEDHLDFYKDQILDVIEVSNGYTNGWWMNLISKKSEDFGNHIYYGFSGDLLAGSMLFDTTKLSIEELAKLSFVHKSQYDFLKPASITLLTGIDTHSLMSNYLTTFSNYGDSVKDAYFNQEKNERNYKRIASFADGSRLGSIPVWLFHDYKIIEFYKSLDWNWLMNEKMHKYLASYKNKIFRTIPMAAKTNLHDLSLSFLIKFIGKNNLLELNHIKKKIKHFRKKETLPPSIKKHLIDNSPFILQNMPELNWEAFDKIIKKANINNHDCDTLIMRLSDIIYSIYFLENRQIYNHTIQDT